MKFSAFSPLGKYKLRASPPRARDIYYAKRRALEDKFSFEIGSRMDCTCFAQAMAEAGADAFVNRAADQRVPGRTFDALPVREQEYGLPPSPIDTVAERKAAYVAHRRLPAGNSYPNMRQALADLLGDDFVALRKTKVAELLLYPASIGTSPMNLQLPTVARKIVTLDSAVSVLGSNTVAYTVVDQPLDALGVPVSDLFVGDVLVVEPGRLGLEERITLTAVSGGTLTAVFARPHGADVLGITAPYPMWTSNQRHLTIVVSASAAQDPSKRNKVHNLMAKMARGVTTWSVVPYSGNAAGPFVPNLGIPNITPVIAVTLP